MSDMPLFDYARARNNTTTPRAPARRLPGADRDVVSEDVKRIWRYLRDCVGSDHAAKAWQIAEAIGLMPDRRRERRGDYVRRLINENKLHAPFVIIADPANGFYRPSGPDDLEHFFNSQRSRIREIATNSRHTRLLAIREGYVRTGPTSWDILPS